jgi:hypothetical protein
MSALKHPSIELYNIVQSKDDPNQGKIIDFGRAIFTSDQDLLADQVEKIKSLLEI